MSEQEQQNDEGDVRVLDPADSPFDDIPQGTPSVVQEPLPEQQKQGFTLDDIRGIVAETLSSYRPPQPQAQPQPQTEQPDLSELLYTDPRRAFDMVKQEILSEWEQREAARRAEEQEKQAWQAFSTRYPELEPFLDLAQTTYYRNPNQYASLLHSKGLDGVMTQLATDVKKRLAFPAKSQEGTDRTAHVIGREAIVPQSKAAPEAPKPVTFAEQLKARRQARETAPVKPSGQL